MNVVSKFAAEPAAGIAIADDPASLSMFRQAENSATLWRRQIPPEIESWLAELDPELLPTGRVVLAPNAVSTSLGHLFDMSGLPKGPERDWLHEDIVFLADNFTKVMDANFLRLRLDVVTTNSCRKFHIDAITGRLICTYRGTGTQYGFSEEGDDPTRVFTVPTGAPILLRGTLWPAQPPSGLLHRSPPIEGTSETRLVLVLDPVFALDDEV